MTESRGSSTLFFINPDPVKRAIIQLTALCFLHFILLMQHGAAALITNLVWFSASLILLIKSIKLSRVCNGNIKTAWRIMSLYSFLLLSAFAVKTGYTLFLPEAGDSVIFPVLFFSANISMAAVFITMSRSGKTPYDIRRQLYLIGIILLTLLILSYILNIYGYSSRTEIFHLIRSLIFSHSAIFVLVSGISIYWMNIWRKAKPRKNIFIYLLSGMAISYGVSILYYTPRILNNQIPEGGFADILLTFSISLSIIASETEKEFQNHGGEEIPEKDFNLIYVSRIERLIPSLCLSLIVLVIYYRRSFLENEIIAVLALFMIPFITLMALFEWSSYRSESWFFFMLSRTPMGIQITDKKMKKNLFVNESFYKLFGSEVINADTIQEQAPESYKKEIMEAVEKGTSLDIKEMPLTRNNGDPFFATLKIIPARYYSQDILIYWALDITERKKFEDLILQQRDTAETSNLYRGTLLENISSKMLSGYLIGKIKETATSIDLVLTGMNRQAMEILETDESSLNKTFAELFPRPSQNLIKTVEKAYRNGESVRMEIYSKRLKKHLLLVIFKSSDDEIVCLINDITETRKTEMELQEKEREIHNLMANLPGMAYRCLNDDHWTMLFVSQGSINLSGYTPEDIANGTKQWNDIIHPDDRGNVWLTVQKAIDRKTQFHIEYRIVTKQGEIRHVWEKGTGVFDDQGRLLFLEGFMLDVTKQVEAETSMRQSEEKIRQTEKLNAISQMAGGIAHDLNNNLMAIQSLSSLIELKAPDRGLKKYTDSINDVIGKASQLIDKLEAFARKKDLSSEMLSINLMLENVASLLKDIFPQEIDININLNAGKDICRGDQIHLDNAFLYICMNSKEAMPNGGSLSIETENIYLSREFFIESDQVRQPGEYIRIAISDTGSGIEKQDMKRIFEPFFTTKPVGKGTGLSLSAVFGTIESHHGIITVNSESGNGATFTIYLPLEVQ